MADQFHLSDRDVSLLDSFLYTVPDPSKFDFLPSLGEEMLSPTVGQDANIAQDVHHWIPEPEGVVTVNEDSAPIQLLQEDYLVIEAVRRILCLEILGNAATVQQYRWILMKLRDNLLQVGEAALHKVRHREEYATVLMRLSGRIFATLDSESALSVRPLGYVECLNMLLENMESGFVIMKQSGVEPDVFIMKDEEPVGYSERLCSLASHLTRDC